MNETLESAGGTPRDVACERARSSASKWLDGELDDTSALFAHTESCGACREHLVELRETRNLLQILRGAESNLDLWPRIEASIRAAKAPVAPRWSRLLPRLAAAAIGFLATTLFLRERSRLPSRQSSTPAATASWTAPLDSDPLVERGFSSAPERQLLAALDTATERRR